MAWEDSMKITIKDIANECGVSVSTVSMALSDKPNRISPETRQKVKDAAR
jgi:LacI family transcriptional regulator